MKKIFYQCFSNNLKEYLKSRGHAILLRAKHYETLRDMWIFLYDEDGKLQDDLLQWTSVKHLD